MIFKLKNIKLKDQLNVILRSPRDTDAKAILDYLKTVTGETPYLLRKPEECTDTIMQEVLFIQSINQHPTQVMILAVKNDEIIGISNVGLKQKLKMKHRATLGISILKKYWGYGLGSVMMDHLIEMAKSFGAERLELEVIEGNDRAIHLYQQKGFQFMSEINDAIKYSDGTYSKEYVMTLNLLK